MFVGKYAKLTTFGNMLNINDQTILILHDVVKKKGGRCKGVTSSKKRMRFFLRRHIKNTYVDYIRTMSNSQDGDGT